jgi:hypothetical protein
MARSRTNGPIKVAAIAIIAMSSLATAHEWHPTECCSNMDCAPVERVEIMPDGFQRLTSRVGTTVVPASFPRRPSSDNQMHICMVRYSHFDDMRPTCFFVPMNVMGDAP